MGKYRKMLPRRVNGLIFNHCLLQVLPKKGQLIVQVQTAAPVAVQPERSNQEVSSGAGELSDSMSAAEVSNVRKKKSRVRAAPLPSVRCGCFTMSVSNPPP